MNDLKRGFANLSRLMVGHTRLSVLVLYMYGIIRGLVVSAILVDALHGFVV